MLVIYRTVKELFTTTVANSFKKRPFVCAINAIQYSLNYSGKASAIMGDPDEASDTTPDGILVNQGVILGGRAASQMFYVVNDPLGGYDFGEGNPPQVGMSGVGGVGPIIINRLPYGVGNRCRLPAACAPTGTRAICRFGRAAKQRYLCRATGQVDFDGKDHRRHQQESRQVADHGPAQRKDRTVIRRHQRGLMVAGCDNAVFLDGSDSSMLNVAGILEVPPGAHKNETNTIGLAFYA